MPPVPRQHFIDYVTECARDGRAVDFDYLTTSKGAKHQRLDYYALVAGGIMNKASNYVYAFGRIVDYGDPMHVYVGQSSKSPDVRLGIHMSRGMQAARVFKRGAKGKLRPDLYEHLERFDDQGDALAMEAQLAEELRGRGFRVEGGH